MYQVHMFRREIPGRIGAIGIVIVEGGYLIMDRYGREVDIALWRHNNKEQ